MRYRRCWKKSGKFEPGFENDAKQGLVRGLNRESVGQVPYKHGASTVLAWCSNKGGEV